MPAPDNAGEQAAGEEAARFVQQILSGPYREAWEEMLDLLRKTGQVLPAASLPLVLEWLAKEKSRFEEARPLLGARGRWLMAQLPEWQPLLKETDPKSWQIASLEERKKILLQVRKTNPEAGLQQLRSTWAEDGWKERHELLKRLETGLSLSDESFLETCLDDKRREIRHCWHCCRVPPCRSACKVMPAPC
jgi:hypothetical protein